MVPNIYMCVSALVSWHDHSASDTASVCGTGAATAPACSFLSSPGPSQGVHQDHVHAAIFSPTTGACSVNATIILPDLRLQQFLLTFPPLAPNLPHAPRGLSLLPSQVLLPLWHPPPPLPSHFSCSLLGLHVLCQGCIPGKCSLWEEGL